VTATLLQDYVARAAERDGDRTALVLGDDRVTYGELDASSSRLAGGLADVGCRPGDRVAVLAPKLPATVTGMLAALKAGCAYVPLDVASPAARVGHVVASADPGAVLATHTTAALLDELVVGGAITPGTPIVSLDPGPLAGRGWESVMSGADVASLPAVPPRVVARREQAAHLLFTSGSTGVPKGVVISHANVLHFIEWATRYFGLTPDDRLSSHPPLHFDLSTFDLYGAFAVGAELHLVPPSANLLPQRLAAFIRHAELTQWFSVPSTLAFMARADAVGDFASLRRVLACGEVLPTPVLAHWMRRLPGVRFTNLYGPTEATIASSFHTIPVPPADDAAPVPIGRAIPGEELLVLDDRREPVPAGEVGDLYIAGAGLSAGYWRDPERTRQVFVEDPARSGRRLYRTGDLARVDADGVVHFVGRADSQIKSRGYRIELGEIETALARVDGLAESAVVAVESDGFEGTAICCAYAPLAGVDVAPPSLRTQLTAVLPTYMLPVRWLALDALPKNVNGKIDRSALRQRFVTEAAMTDRAGAATP
jgi:amino acid adenylation domain-containing protein